MIPNISLSPFKEVSRSEIEEIDQRVEYLEELDYDRWTYVNHLEEQVKNLQARQTTLQNVLHRLVLLNVEVIRILNHKHPVVSDSSLAALVKSFDDLTLTEQKNS